MQRGLSRQAIVSLSTELINGEVWLSFQLKDKIKKPELAPEVEKAKEKRQEVFEAYKDKKQRGIFRKKMLSNNKAYDKKAPASGIDLAKG